MLHKEVSKPETLPNIWTQSKQITSIKFHTLHFLFCRYKKQNISHIKCAIFLLTLSLDTYFYVFYSVKKAKYNQKKKKWSKFALRTAKPPKYLNLF